MSRFWIGFGEVTWTTPSIVGVSHTNRSAAKKSSMWIQLTHWPPWLMRPPESELR